MGLDSYAEEQVRLLADSRNRAVLTILDDAGEPLHVEELANRLVTRDVFVVDSAEFEDQLDRAVLSLHHDRLPRLADAHLVEYDYEKNIAAYPTATVPSVEWEGEAPLDSLVEHLPTSHEADEDAIGVIEGRESAVRYGRQLADNAEEELFCMYVGTDLLGDDCIVHAADAIERGVAVYVGSQNAEVRELIQKHLPDATIWEPQLDWLNSSTNPRVGRLVFADRRKVMLAIIQEPASDETDPEEIALVGEGENNPVVTLVRDLLGPRLDHLDYQSTEFRATLSSER